MAAVKVLIVDDEIDILDLLEYNFEKEGYAVARAMNGKEAIDEALKSLPDLVVMDIMMPVMDGVAACHTMRTLPELERTQIIFLTARAEEYSEIAGFEAGADDYITKPIRPRVLMSRARALLRRRETVQTNQLKIHDLEIIRDEYIVKCRGEELFLPRKEFELLYFMASRPGKVFRRDELLTEIWENIHVTDRTVDVHIRKLRSKLGPDYIHTVKGVGYKFVGEK